MASIRKRGNKWQVQVRRKGCADQSRSFNSKADAQAWARHIETLADRNGLPVNAKVLEQTSLTDLLTRYRDEVVPLKRGREIEKVIINAFLRNKLARTRLSELKASDFAAYRDQRLKTVKPATINRELGVISHCINVATKEWSIPLSTNPLTEIRKPKLANRRERRLLEGEWTKLLQAADKCRNPYIKPIMQLALETGMRRGEILAIEWGHIDWKATTLHIPITKNGHARTIPLSPNAIGLLKGLRTSAPKGAEPRKTRRLFPISIVAFKLAWKRVLARAGIDDLHFHDLRHEAISRFFELGLSVPEVALISGHRDPRMLFRYTHLKAEDLVGKLGAVVSGELLV